MARRQTNALQPINAVSFPLPQKHWKEICRTLGLTGQLTRIVELILRDFGDKEIADEMGLALGTVKVYLARIAKLTNTNGRVQLLIYLLKISHDLLTAPAAPRKKQR